MQQLESHIRINPTSYQNLSVEATLREMIEALGEPTEKLHYGSDMQYLWRYEDEDEGFEWEVSDWGEDRIRENDLIAWRVYAPSRYTARIAEEFLQNQLALVS
jgi:hypothetical protein